MTPLRRLLHYFARYRWSLLWGGLAVIGATVFSLTKPLIVGNAVNELSESLSRDVLVKWALLYLGAAVVQGIFLFLHRWILIGTSRRIEYDMRNDLYQHLQKLPQNYFQHQRTGDLMSRATNDLSSVRMLVGPAVMHAFSSVLVVIGAFIMMLQIDRMLALACVVVVPFIAGMVKYFGDRIHVQFRSVQDYFGEISSKVQENLAGVRVVRAYGQESNEIGSFKAMNHEYVERNRTLIRLTAVFYPLLHVVIALMFILVFWVGGRKMVAGTMTIGAFVAFQFYLGRMIWPLIALGWVINLFQRGMASMKRLVEVWDAEPAATEEEHAEVPPPAGEIEVRGLTFAYDREPVLRDIDLRVKPGETVGIVGRTGSGKSTLLSLLTRVHEPPAETVFIDGVPVERLPLFELRERIGAVPQETFLFSETIEENVRFGRESATRDEIAGVTDLAGLTGDLESFPRGLDTMVGERGITLSGGQKQRTAIARAIVRDPRILLLDDALSAVDTQTEERILRALREVRKGRTVLIVAHRVSSVKDADQIVVLDDGAIVERGTHEELLEAGGFYADLYRRQTLEEEIEEIA